MPDVDPVTPGDERFRMDACPIRERNPGHGRGPIGPCEDISQCPWCMSMCASLRPLDEFFYDHDGDCPHVLHWGSCSDPEPVENRSTRFLAEAVAAERVKTANEIAEQIEAEARAFVGFLVGDTSREGTWRLVGSEDAYRDAIRIARSFAAGSETTKEGGSNV